ncbi:MAG: hypothetical protein WCP96_01145 [Methylococcaceae bacterium]
MFLLRLALLSARVLSLEPEVPYWAICPPEWFVWGIRPSPLNRVLLNKSPASFATKNKGPHPNVTKLSRSLSEVEAIFPASAPLSQRFIFPRGA